MNIEILKLRNTIGFSKYHISIEGVLSYKGRTNFFLPHTTFKVFDLKKNQLIKIVAKRYRRGMVNHELTFTNNKSYQFQSESYLEHSLFVDSTKISFYEQKGHDVGIFIDDEQIGILTKNKRYRRKGDFYSIKLKESKVDFRVIIGCLLPYDVAKYGDERNTRWYCPGNVSIKPIKLIDQDWEP